MANAFRIGFFGYFVSIGLAYFYILPKAAYTGQMRSRLSVAMLGLVGLLVIGVITLEFRSQVITRWLRKTNDISSDNRSFMDALTDSRQGGVERCLYEFRRSPWLGSGFQVVEEHPAAYAIGEITLFTAPCEKGLLPLMVLGETGVVGAFVFGLFLISFYVGCSQKKYAATLALFVLLLATNMGEATFFAPSGGGGVLWLLTVVGGFLIDMTLVLERKRMNPDFLL